MIGTGVAKVEIKIGPYQSVRRSTALLDQVPGAALVEADFCQGA